MSSRAGLSSGSDRDRDRGSDRGAGGVSLGGSLRIIGVCVTVCMVFGFGLVMGATVFHFGEVDGSSHPRPWETWTQSNRAGAAAGPGTPRSLATPRPTAGTVGLPTGAAATGLRGTAAPAPAAPAPSRPSQPAFTTEEPPAAAAGEGAEDQQVAPVETGGGGGGIIDKYMVFDGFLHVATHSPMDAADVTVAAWVYLDGSDASEQIKTIVANRESGCSGDAQHYGYALYVNEWNTANRRLKLDWGNAVDGCNTLMTAEGAIPMNAWVHVAFSISSRTAAGGTAMLFINGDKVATGVATKSVQTSIPMRIGMFADGKYGFVGRIAHVVVLKSLVTPEQLGFMYQHQSGEQLQNLVDAAKSRMLGAILLDGTYRKAKDLISSLEFGYNGKPLNGGTPIARGTAATNPVPPPPAPAPVDDTPSVAPPSSVGSDGSISGSKWIGKWTRMPQSLASGSVTDPAALAAGTFSDFVSDAALKASDDLGRQRAAQIKDAMKHAWGNYERHAYGSDELLPRSGRGNNNWGGIGMTLVDSLDTLWIMGMHDEFNRARDWVASSLSFNKPVSSSVFEITIRELGGLLAAYEFSEDRVFLDKAHDLGDRLLRAFDTPTGIPNTMVNLDSGYSTVASWAGGAILSELGTLQVEFRALSKHTGDTKYARAVEQIMERMEKLNPPNGLYPIFINPNNAQPVTTKITFGALGDSFYEYLLKVWLQGGKSETMYRNMYDKAMQGMTDVLLKRSSPAKLLFVSDYDGGYNALKMDHLVCFTAGMLALGAHTSSGTPGEQHKWRDLQNAKALGYTCFQMYDRMATGLSAEYVEFRGAEDFEAAPSAPFYILRPEAAESMFILHQITGNPIYREWGWKMFQGIHKNCRTEFGYGAHPDVRNTGRVPDDRMESFFLAETLKYLYLLQDPDHTISLEKYVFNTEAHPLRMFS